MICFRLSPSSGARICEQAPVGPAARQHRVEIGRPLHQADDPAEPAVVGQPEEHVLMPEARPMAEPERVHPIEGVAQLADLGGRKHALDDGVAQVAIVLEICAVHAGPLSSMSNSC